MTHQLPQGDQFQAHLDSGRWQLLAAHAVNRGYTEFEAREFSQLAQKYLESGQSDKFYQLVSRLA